MLLNGTIRRKMCVVLLLVLGMLITLSASALSGLNSYRLLVRELDFSIYEAPRRSDLSEAVGSLFHPLTTTYPTTADGAGAQRREFEKRLGKARERFVDFHRRLDQLPSSKITDDFKSDTEPLLRKMDIEWSEMEKDSWRLGDLSLRKATVEAMRQRVARLQALSQQVPDFQSGMNESLKRARAIYRSRIKLVIGTTGVVLVLFLFLGYVVYAGILDPVRKLHQGAMRVADGDFRYRLDLPRGGEMSELADAFNRMTDRFQESQQDLNRQVEERSRQLVRSERLAGIGFLATCIAHEINNPLSAISMAAESLAERHETLADPNIPADAQAVVFYLEMIRRETERCEQITRKLLDFAHGKDGERRQVDLTRLVSEVLDMVRPMYRSQNRNVEFYRTQPCLVELNGPEIKQVVLNIVSNALESLQEGGTLRIRIAEQTDSVQLTFQDDGCGMTDEVLDQLFDPFFTHGKEGRGTGLGMAISQRIITDHAGHIEVESAGPEQGSTFRIHLPRRAVGDAQAA